MLKIKQFSSKYLKEWNKFLSISNNGTLFHNKIFLSYHIDRRFRDHSLMIYYKNILVALFPAVIQKRGRVFSHPGTSYGGFVIKSRVSFSILNELINSVGLYYKRKKMKSIFIINTPKIYYRLYHDSLNYLLRWNGYQQKEMYISHAVDLSCNKINLLLNKRKQRYVKNSMLNIRFVNSKNFKSFYKLLVLNKKKYNSRPTHSLEELIKLKNLFPEKIKLFLSNDCGVVVGGSLLFYTNKKSCLVFYNVVCDKYRNSQLSTLQLYNCMQVAKRGGFDIIDFGVSHSPEKKNPLEPKFSLIKFKEQFGAFGVTRTCYEKEL